MNFKCESNLFHCYQREMVYWESLWKQQDIDILKRMDESIMCHCPDFVLNFVSSIRDEINHKPRVMDFGCGPFSNINYLHKKGLADVLGVDVLADEYHKFYSKYNIAHPIPMISCSGEALCEQKTDGKFDFVYVQNALDHTASPILTWMNLYRLTKLGGYLGHCHAVNEATYQNKDQLHQYDLRPENKELLIDDLDGQMTYLSKGLDLDLVFEDIFEVAPDKQANKRPNYFCHIYRKTGDSISAHFMGQALENLRKSFIKRSDWAFHLEKFLD